MQTVNNFIRYLYFPAQYPSPQENRSCFSLLFSLIFTPQESERKQAVSDKRKIIFNNGFPRGTPQRFVVTQVIPCTLSINCYDSWKNQELKKTDVELGLQQNAIVHRGNYFTIIIDNFDCCFLHVHL